MPDPLISEEDLGLTQTNLAAAPAQKGKSALPDADFSSRVAILIEGAKLTQGDRDKSYGDPIYNLTLAGELKNLIRIHARRNISPGELEALDNVLAKVARCITGGYKRDNYVDGATYFAIAGELGEKAEANLKGNG